MKDKEVKLSNEDILDIAELANITVRKEEIAKFQKQLSDILVFIGKLNEVDTHLTEDLNQVTGIKNRSRDDEIDLGKTLSTEKALRNSTSTKDDLFQVDAIFSDE